MYLREKADLSYNANVMKCNAIQILLSLRNIVGFSANYVLKWAHAAASVWLAKKSGRGSSAPTCLQSRFLRGAQDAL